MNTHHGNSAILVDGEILKEIEKGTIVITPFDRDCLGSNSYDVHLGKTLAIYKDYLLDSKKHNPIEYIDIPDDGYVLIPGRFYLGSTVEYTETHQHVPFLEGRSSSGRLGGLQIHSTAGKGDVGFSGNWTMEISCIQPVRIYAGMPIAQILYFCTNHQKIINPYNKKVNAHYIDQTSSFPKESMMFQSFSN